MRTILFCSALLLLTEILTGCSGSDSTIPQPVSLPGAPGFFLLAEGDGAGRASQPFGALIGMGESQPTLCSAAHVSPGLVLTAGHCLKSSHPSQYFLVFWDQSGRPTVTQAITFRSLGHPSREDVAEILIPNEVAAQWPTTGATIVPTAASRGAKPPQAIEATVWAFDALALRPDLAANYGTWGAVLSPRKCTASRTQPLAVPLAPWSREPLTGSAVSPEKISPKIDLFLDHCSSPLLEGNSGALITLAGRSDAPLGVYHSTVSPSENQLRQYPAFYYRGNNNVEEHVPREAAARGLFELGTALDSLSLR